MNSLLTGSVQSWLAVAATTLSPLIVLIVGFEEADWLLRRRLGEACEHARLGGEPGARAIDDRAPAPSAVSVAGCDQVLISPPVNLSATIPPVNDRVNADMRGL